MIAPQGMNLVKRLAEYYRHTKHLGNQVIIKKFKVLDITFNSLPSLLYRDGNKYVYASEQNATLYGYVIIINGQWFFVNADGKFHLEDEKGFVVNTLEVARQENLNVVYDAEIQVNYVAEPSPYPPVKDEYTLCEPFETYDKITQNTRGMTAPNTNFLLNRTIEGYTLVRIDIEADAGTEFTFNSNVVTIGNTEFLTLEANSFTQLYYTGEVETTADIIVRYYYKEVSS